MFPLAQQSCDSTRKSNFHDAKCSSDHTATTTRPSNNYTLDFYMSIWITYSFMSVSSVFSIHPRSQNAPPHRASCLHNQFFHTVFLLITVHSILDSLLNPFFLKIAWCFKYLQSKNREFVYQ